jgi:N-methylhydantoinase A
MELDVRAAESALDRAIAGPLGLDRVAAADAILAVADRKMSDALEEITISQGVDPRECVVIAGGGAGGLSVDQIARDLGCTLVIVPRVAASLTAYGGVHCEIARDFRQTYYATTRSFDFDGVATTLDNLKGNATEFLAVFGTNTRHTLEWFVSARYGYQRWEIEIPLKTSTIVSDTDIHNLRCAFDSAHERHFAVKQPDHHVEFITWRLRASVNSAQSSLHDSRSSRADELPPSLDRTGGQLVLRDVFFRGHGWLRTRILSGHAILPGQSFIGPSIIEEPATTIVIRPGSEVRVLPSGDFGITPVARFASRTPRAHAAQSAARQDGD